MSSIKMNQCCRDLFEYFLSRFPDSDEESFRIVAEATIAGHKIEENLTSMSSATAELLAGIFSRLSEKHLIDWIFGVLASERDS